MKKINIFLIQLFLCLFLSYSTYSQSGTSDLKVVVTPDHNNWTYNVNETAKFSVQVLKSGNLLNNAIINYETGPEYLPDEKKEGVVLKSGMTEIPGTMNVPGFFRVRAQAAVEGRMYEGMATAAFDPEKIQPYTKEPEDFDAFWTNAIAEARKVNLDSRITLIPERCTSKNNVYQVSFSNESPTSRIYGILIIPVKPGKYPAILRVPGAGVRPYVGDTTLASRGFITFEIGIHGIPVTLDPQVYKDLLGGALANYPDIRLDDRNRFYYKRVYLGCIKAVDFIFSLPEFNGTDIAVTGRSQGGALTIITAALDRRIKFMAVSYPALCDLTGYLNKRAGGWPHYFRNTEPKTGELETLGYYDVVNFAKRISIPGYYTWGYNDLTVPPTSMYAAYNVITAPKILSIYKETGHFLVPEQTELLNNWLTKQLKTQ